MSLRQEILCVGLCCLDIISQLPQFPKEDTDQRCHDQRWQRGGNAANNCTVLGLLGAKPSFLGTIAGSHEKTFLLDDFAKYNVDTKHVVVHEDCDCPASCVILSMETGSRTIIHSNKNLPELTVEDFRKVDLSSYTWVHFEGRNVSNVVGMIEVVRKHNGSHKDVKPVIISVELEKSKPELSSLIPKADVIFVSKDYAQFQGYTDMAQTIDKIHSETRPGSLVICPWGEKGASARLKEGQIVSCHAFPPDQVVDTLGAGDTFIAASIFALAQGHKPEDSILFGCRVAGAKVGVRGWEPLSHLFKDCDFLPAVEDSNSRRDVVMNTT
ncbi:ketohexokinase-like isoform X2 [Penaeus japonicus]|uniref:ketohexokinase-like isoform X2 n=1 Tax=Penaeus japonicus TaxID=27405 RepID=UPI001C71355A|nr:ketohexokinase-like isoform X2 [Penaeus japonicus]